ncbi:MAG: 4'-phosphopantetheinyl transferase superfamily protein [Planctomycetes bacterium]|nr:4'-phosphopantetheinyl transferase superfamily protein [Planctomycetota bacterium]MBI3832902.1 4'-phosphopantetheinyl transferase superfamily protein [Planctomycetota bacterium]
MTTQAASMEVNPAGLLGLERARDLHAPIPRQPVVVWCVSLSASESKLAELESVLSPDERVRSSCFMFPHGRRRFIVARAALRMLLAKCIGASPSALRFEYGAFGKPQLPSPFEELHFNLSHSGDVALVATSACSVVGIDIEQIRPVPDADGMAREFLARREYELFQKAPHCDRDRKFLSLWTRKEACLKAFGWGLSVDTKEIDAAEPGCGLVAPPPDSITTGCTRTLFVREIEGITGFVAAIATDNVGCKLALTRFAIGEEGT